MKNQNGSSIVVALVLLVIITIAAVYSLESSNIQSKMVANSLFSTLTYQECRNEQESQIRFYNQGNGQNLNNLFALELLASNTDENGKEIGKILENEITLTEDVVNPQPPKSDLNIVWRYIGTGKGVAKGGNSLDEEAPSEDLVFENDCTANFRFSTNSQTLGATVDKLRIVGLTD